MSQARRHDAFYEQAAQTLHAMLQQGRGAWPELDLLEEEFFEHIVHHALSDEPTLDALPGLHAADLYLACGCTQGHLTAVKTFDRSILSQVPQFLSRLQPTPATVDEVRQILSERLLVGHGDAPPRIAAYGGRAPLASWVRISAVREALRLYRRKGDQPGQAAELLDALPGDSDPEMLLIRERCKKEFSAVFQQALAALSSEQRNLLRMYFVDELNTTRIATIFQVNRSTAVRWLHAARDELRDTTRRLLQQRLALSEESARSLIGLVHSQIQISLLRHLAA